MRTFRLLLEYDGTPFNGWQIQLDQPEVQTVQGALESALLTLTGEAIRARAASRTDAGVHARGQVVAIDVQNDGLPPRAFELGLIPFLPREISVRKAEVVPDGWDPRRTSRGKRYRYTFWYSRTRSALDGLRSWHIHQTMDLDAMRQGAGHLLGSHDFEAFRATGCSSAHALRTLYEVRIEKGDYDRVHLDIVGNAFVRNMVRIIAGNLRDVAIGKIPPARIREILESRDRTIGGVTAPACGLCLEEVIYDDRLPPRPEGAPK